MACPHKQIVLVYTTGKKRESGGNEKDLLVKCSDCDEEFLKMPTYGKRVINLLPD